MLSRSLISGMTLLLVLVVFTGGCSRKIVKPTPPPPAPSSPYVGVPSPGAVTEQELQGVQAELNVIYFDYDQYTLSSEAQAACQYNAETLRRAGHLKVVAEGHCDERGTAEYNLALGERRARSVQEFLIGLGVSPDRITTVSYGSELPVDPGHNESAWAKNRRVYLRVHR